MTISILMNFSADYQNDLWSESSIKTLGSDPNVAVSKINQAEDRFEPRIVKFKGYIQQYPDFDEEDCEDYE